MMYITFSESLTMSASSLLPQNHAVIQALCLSMLLLLSSCGTSRLTATWHDASYGGQNNLQDVLIIAVTKDETVKRLFEDTFAAELEAEGVHAIPSYSLSQPDIKPEKEAIDTAIKEAGARSVIITRHLGTDTKEHYRPPQRTSVFADPYYGGIHGYYPMAYREVYSPGYTVKVTTVSLEANLYDVKTGKLVWAVRSESTDPTMTKKYIEELVNLFSGDLKKNALL